MHFGLDLQGAVLHLEHERHDFRVGDLGQPQGVHSGVIVHIAKILQQIEGETFALQCAFAKLADERLLVAFLPNQVGGLAHALRERRKIVALDAFGGVELIIEIGC